MGTGMGVVLFFLSTMIGIMYLSGMIMAPSKKPKKALEKPVS